MKQDGNINKIKLSHQQIAYFLETAKCLNMSEACKKLYISQPALSKQISNMEYELNMQLFIRDKGKLKLTPAGKILLEELPGYEHHLEVIIKNAAYANKGTQGKISLGFLEGQVVGEALQKKLFEFRKDHPEVALDFYSMTSTKLDEKLKSGELDMAYTIVSHLERFPGFIKACVGQANAILTMAKHHPLASVDKIEFKDMKNETFIMMHESVNRDENICDLEFMKEHSITPNVIYAYNPGEKAMLIETGAGIGFTNEYSHFYNNPNIVTKKLDFTEILPDLVFLWKEDNRNPVIYEFEKYVIRELEC